MLVGVAACASTPNLPLRPDPAPPPGSTTEVVTARDGTQLLARTWAPQGEVRGAVVIMHGLKDYSARYAALATKLAAKGYLVLAFDLRGHGRSAGPRVAPDAWTDYVDDLDRFLTSVEQKVPGKPVFLFGHSMGGAIAARAAELHRPQLAGLVLSGPALQIDAPPLLVAATRMAGFLTPRAPALDLPNQNFSSTPGAAEAMSKDELISQPAGPAKTAAGLVEGMHAIWSDVDHLTMPVLALHGTADKLTAPAGSRALIERAPAADKTLRIYEGFFHDLLHEPKAAQVEDDIVAWVDAHAGGPAVVAPPIHAGRLAGDPRGWTQAVEVGAGIGEGTVFAGDLSVELARPAPLGWHGALTARIAGDYKALALRPIGIAARFGAAMVGVSAGGALLTGTHFAFAAGADAELPLGPIHASLTGEWARASDGPGPLGSTQLWTGGALRLGGDRSYWPHASAGVGPMIGGGLAWLGDTHAWVITAGLELYGAD